MSEGPIRSVDELRPWSAGEPAHLPAGRLPETARWLTGAECSELIDCTKDALRLHRRRGRIVGVKVGSGRLYPAFQIDANRRRIRPEVAETNQRLTADLTDQQVVAWWSSRAGQSCWARIQSSDA